MKILLDSEDLVVDSIVSRCCERVNAEFKKLSDNPEDYDLLIKNCDENFEVLETNVYKTLFLIPKNFNDFSNIKYFIKKPFLPSELIKFLSEFCDTEENVPSNILENNYKQKQLSILENKKEEDIQNISKIVDEIDSIENSSGYEFIQGIDNLLDEVNNFFNDDKKDTNIFDFKLVPVIKYKDKEKYVDLKKRLKEFILNEIKDLKKDEVIKDININITINKEVVC